MGMLIIIDSDEEDEFDDIKLDLHSIKEDYNKKKGVLDNL